MLFLFVVKKVFKATLYCTFRVIVFWQQAVFPDSIDLNTKCVCNNVGCKQFLFSFKLYFKRCSCWKTFYIKVISESNTSCKLVLNFWVWIQLWHSSDLKLMFKEPLCSFAADDWNPFKIRFLLLQQFLWFTYAWGLNSLAKRGRHSNRVTHFQQTWTSKKIETTLQWWI